MLPSLKLTLSLLATITLEKCPYVSLHSSSFSVNILKCILEVVFCEGVQAPPAILPRSPKMRENGGLYALSSIWETQKSRVVRDDSHVILGKNSLDKRDVSDGALS
jgi:hypothetical protein